MPTVCCGRTARLDTDTPWDGQGYPARALLSKPPGIHLSERTKHWDPGPMAAHTRESNATHCSGGKGRAQHLTQTPLFVVKSKRSHSRIRSRTDFSIKLRGRLTCSCFTGLLTLLPHTASQPEKGGALGTGEPALQELNSLLDFRPAIFFPLIDLSHSRAIDSSITQDAPPPAAPSGRSGAGRGGHAHTATRAQ